LAQRAKPRCSLTLFFLSPLLDNQRESLLPQLPILILIIGDGDKKAQRLIAELRSM